MWLYIEQIHLACKNLKWPRNNNDGLVSLYHQFWSVSKAGIPRRRHGHPRQLPREYRPRVGHARWSSPTCPTRGAIFLARMSLRDALVYCVLSCTRLQNYTIGASLMSVSVSMSVQWNSSLTSVVLIMTHHRHIKYLIDNLRPIITAEAFEAVDWLHQQTWLHCGIA